MAGSEERMSCQAPVDLVCVRCPADVRHRAGYSPKQFGPSLDGFARNVDEMKQSRKLGM